MREKKHAHYHFSDNNKKGERKKGFFFDLESFLFWLFKKKPFPLDSQFCFTDPSIEANVFKKIDSVSRLYLIAFAS